MYDEWLLLFHIQSRQNTISAQLTITCSKLTIETLEYGVKYVQSYQLRQQKVINKDTRKAAFIPCAGVSIVSFEHVNVDWETTLEESFFSNTIWLFIFPLFLTKFLKSNKAYTVVISAGLSLISDQFHL